MTVADAAGSREPPLLRVLRGHPTDEELAAVVTVVAALLAARSAAARRASRSPDWSAYWRAMRRSGTGGWPHGPGGWRSSALPR